MLKLMIPVIASVAGIWAMLIRNDIALWLQRRGLKKRIVAWHVRSRLHGTWKIYYITNGVRAEEYARVNRMDHGQDDYDAICIATRAAAENEAVERNLDGSN